MFGIKTALRKSSQRVGLALDYYEALARSQRRKRSTSERAICFFLGEETLNGDDGRNAYMVCSAFARAGYSVLIVPRFALNVRSFGRMGYCARMALKLDGVSMVTQLPENTEGMAAATDCLDLPEGIFQRPFSRWIYVNFLKSSVQQTGPCIQIPYSMHPRIDAASDRNRMSQSRSSARKMRMLFAGNTSKDFYDSPAVKAQGVLSRLESLHVLRERCQPVVTIARSGSLQRHLDSTAYFNGCLLVETGSFGIAPSKWLPLLAKSDFFLCLSGTDYPVCHNAIEAMAVGCVPILGYADWFSPALRHGENAVVFSDAADLERKFQEVLQMTDEQIARMRKSTCEYYDRYLSPASFVRRFEALPSDGPVTLMLFPRYQAKPEEHVQEKLHRFDAVARGRMGSQPMRAGVR